MTRRRRVALGISAALLAVGAALVYFKVPVGYAITGSVMIFHVIFAVLLPGTTGENWLKPKFVVSGLAYLTVCHLYAVVIGSGLRLFGAFKTPAELEKQAAQERGEVPATKAVSAFGKFAKYAAMATFVIVIVWLQGKQEDEFMENSKPAATAHCNQDSACLQSLNQHFSACFETNHESHKSGRFNRKHSLDESGFNNCLASYQTPAQSEHNTDEAVGTTANVSAEGQATPTT